MENSNINKTNNQELSCDVCNKFFKKKSFLQVHHRSHTNDRPYWCKFCKWSFRQPVHLKNHIMKVHNNGEGKKQPNDAHLCIKCYRYCTTVWGLIMHHVNSHKVLGVPVVCFICGKNFLINSEEMLKHCRAEHKLEMESLDQFKDFLLLKNIDDDMFWCLHCNVGFPSYYDSLDHLKLVHGFDTSKYNPDTGLQLKCIFCEQQFKDVSFLVNHLIKAHWPTESVKCIVCEKLFKTASASRKHFRLYRCAIFRRHLKYLNIDIGHLQEDSSTKERKIKCTQCNFTCTIKSQLDLHMRIHRGEKPFQCRICQRSFAQSGNLNKHIRVVHQQTPAELKSPLLACRYCGKPFSATSELEKHERVHTGEKPFACQHCGRTFSQNANLKVHIKRWHGDNTESKSKHNLATFKLKKPLIAEENQDCKMMKFKLQKVSETCSQQDNDSLQINNKEISTGGVFSKFRARSMEPIPQISCEVFNEEEQQQLMGSVDDNDPENRLVCFSFTDLAEHYLSTEDVGSAADENTFDPTTTEYSHNSVITSNISQLSQTDDTLIACADVLNSFHDQTYFDKTVADHEELNEGTFNVEDLFREHAIDDRFLNACASQANDYSQTANELLMVPALSWWQGQYSPPRSINNNNIPNKQLASHTVIKNVSGGEIKDVDTLDI